MLAIENVNPILDQKGDIQASHSQSLARQTDPQVSSTLQPTSKPYQSVWQNLEGISEDQKNNILMRGNKVITKTSEIQNYFHNSQDPLPSQASHQIEQGHVANLIKKREEAIERLYFSFIGKALEETQKTNTKFSFQDALLALIIAKKFGGVSNKLNANGDGYESLALQDVNNFLSELQKSPINTKSWASALDVKEINEKKFTQLKKFSALYQKYAGEYFKSARDEKTSARLTFFPDRFTKELTQDTGNAEKLVADATKKVKELNNTRLYV